MHNELDPFPFSAEDGTTLFAGSWLPDTDIRAHLLLVHGIAEHIERYAHVGAFFASHGIAVHGLDHRGHGKSEGRRVYVDRFDAYVEDLARFHNHILATSPAAPVFALGHSMGGTILLLYLMQQPELRGAVLSAPGIEAGDDIPPILIKLSGVLGKLVPKLPTLKLDSSGISRDPQVVARYDADPLIFRGGIPARTGAELNRALERIQDGFASITSPLLIVHGTSDAMVAPNGSRRLHEHAGSLDKTLKLYDGLFHELMNEPEQNEVLAEMLSWLEARLAA